MAQTCNDSTSRATPQATGQSTSQAAACVDLKELLQPELFRALSDPNRLTLLSQLAASPEPRTVGELDSCCAVDLSVVSRHLAVLREAGVVEAEKRGRRVYYSICCQPLVELLRGVADALECCAANECQPQLESREKTL